MLSSVKPGAHSTCLSNVTSLELESSEDKIKLHLGNYYVTSKMVSQRFKHTYQPQPHINKTRIKNSSLSKAQKFSLMIYFRKL